MLKVIVLLDCNECGKALDVAFVKSDFLSASTLKFELDDTRKHAERLGWGFMHEFYCVCPECIDRQNAHDDWLISQEEYEQG